MLWLLEWHMVKGDRAEDFVRIYAEGAERWFQGQLGKLVWKWEVTHASGMSNRFLTALALQDSVAWARLLQQADQGDLHDWLHELDQTRRCSTSRVMTSVAWCPLNDSDYGDLVSQGNGTPNTLYCLDFGRPYASRSEYIDFLYEWWFKPENGRIYGGMATIEACFSDSFGSGRSPQVLLVQRIDDEKRWFDLLYDKPSMTFQRRNEYLKAGLRVRDQWTSVLARTAGQLYVS